MHTMSMEIWQVEQGYAVIMAYFILSLQVVDNYICYIVDNLSFVMNIDSNGQILAQCSVRINKLTSW